MKTASFQIYSNCLGWFTFCLFVVVFSWAKFPK